MKITYVKESTYSGCGWPTFLKKLGDALGKSVDVFKGPLKDAPKDSFLLFEAWRSVQENLKECEFPDEVASRLIGVGGDNASAATCCETNSLLGWLPNDELHGCIKDKPDSKLIGLRDLISEGSMLVHKSLSQRYDLLEGRTKKTLPLLLLDYLRASERRAAARPECGLKLINAAATAFDLEIHPKLTPAVTLPAKVECDGLDLQKIFDPKSMAMHSDHSRLPKDNPIPPGWKYLGTNTSHLGNDKWQITMKMLLEPESYFDFVGTTPEECWKSFRSIVEEQEKFREMKKMKESAPNLPDGWLVTYRSVTREDCMGNNYNILEGEASGPQGKILAQGRTQEDVWKDVVAKVNEKIRIAILPQADRVREVIDAARENCGSISSGHSVMIAEYLFQKTEELSQVFKQIADLSKKVDEITKSEEKPKDLLEKLPGDWSYFVSPAWGDDWVKCVISHPHHGRFSMGGKTYATLKSEIHRKIQSFEAAAKSVSRPTLPKGWVWVYGPDYREHPAGREYGDYRGAVKFVNDGTGAKPSGTWEFAGQNPDDVIQQVQKHIDAYGKDDLPEGFTIIEHLPSGVSDKFCGCVLRHESGWEKRFAGEDAYANAVSCAWQKHAGMPWKNPALPHGWKTFEVFSGLAVQGPDTADRWTFTGPEASASATAWAWKIATSRKAVPDAQPQKEPATPRRWDVCIPTRIQFPDGWRVQGQAAAPGCNEVRYFLVGHGAELSLNARQWENALEEAKAWIESTFPKKPEQKTQKKRFQVTIPAGFFMPDGWRLELQEEDFPDGSQKISYVLCPGWGEVSWGDARWEEALAKTKAFIDDCQSSQVVPSKSGRFAVIMPDDFYPEDGSRKGWRIEGQTDSGKDDGSQTRYFLVGHGQAVPLSCKIWMTAVDEAKAIIDQKNRSAADAKADPAKGFPPGWQYTCDYSDPKGFSAKLKSPQGEEFCFQSNTLWGVQEKAKAFAIQRHAEATRPEAEKVSAIVQEAEKRGHLREKELVQVVKYLVGYLGHQPQSLTENLTGLFLSLLKMAEVYLEQKTHG